MEPGASQWINGGREDLVTCVVCHTQNSVTGVDGQFTGATQRKLELMGQRFMERRFHRCRKCGAEFGERHNEQMQIERSEPLGPDRCCHIFADGARCPHELIKDGLHNNVSKTQWRKGRGDRRCKKCAELHAIDTWREVDRDCFGKPPRGSTSKN